MNNLLNLDGPVMQLINKIVYSVYLNILWFIYYRTLLCHIEDSKK